MKIAFRAGLLLLSAVAIPSCWDGHYGSTWWGDQVHVTVQNIGTASADVHAEAEYWSGLSWEDHLDFSVPAMWTKEVDFPLDNLTRLEIRVVRSSDGLELFHDSWDRGDLDHLDDRVTISVSP